METPYAAFRRSVLTRINLAAGVAATREPTDDKPDRVIAAAALVLSERGPQWCLDNPTAYRDLTLKKLGPFIKIAATLLGILTGGSTIWLSLAASIIPAILELLQTRRQSFGSGSYCGDYGPAFGAAAANALKGTK